MIKTFSKFIDKLLWPQRVRKNKKCNVGLWWFIPALANAVGSVAGAIGSAAGSAAGAIGSGVSSAIGGIGSALGMGGTAAAETGALATPASVLTPGGLAATQAAPSILGAAPSIGSGAILPGSLEKLLIKAGINPVTTGTTGFNLKNVANLALKELTPFGDITNPDISAKEKVSKTAVNMAKSQQDEQKSQQLPKVSIDNSFQGKSPNFVDAGTAPTSGNAQSIPPEIMMQIMQMMKKQKSQGGTRPLASNNFPGGFY